MISRVSYIPQWYLIALIISESNLLTRTKDFAIRANCHCCWLLGGSLTVGMLDRAGSESIFVSNSSIFSILMESKGIS